MKCEVSFTVDDLMAIKPFWTRARAARWLSDNVDEIEEAMVEAGEAVINSLLRDDSIEDEDL